MVQCHNLKLATFCRKLADLGFPDEVFHFWSPFSHQKSLKIQCGMCAVIRTCDRTFCTAGQKQIHFIPINVVFCRFSSTSSMPTMLKVSFRDALLSAVACGLVHSSLERFLSFFDVFHRPLIFCSTNLRPDCSSRSCA